MYAFDLEKLHVVHNLLSCSLGGSQFKITVNDTILINRIDAETGDRIRIEKVSLIKCILWLTVVVYCYLWKYK